MIQNKQIHASDPNYSVWVSASAGTGKTKILTDRVLRLLLCGVQFEKILCLTFTNAAANEMQERINGKLALWGSLSQAELKNDLAAILAREPATSELQTAGKLYSKLLSAQDKISINTIHAFCQQILKKFPFEAGVNPSFQILDEIKMRKAIAFVKEQIYSSTSNEQMINFFITNFHEVTINDIFDEIIQHKLKFKSIFSANPSIPTLEPKTPDLDNSLEEILEQLKTSLLKLLDDQTIAKLTLDPVAFFLTKEGEKRKRLISAKQVKEKPELSKELEHWQEVIYQFDQQQKIKQVMRYSALFLELAQLFIRTYENYKAKHGLLDYDDLIYFTKKLLIDSSAKEWVLYKLDGGIDHLLVDEAQDTSPEQWEIITAIIEEFYVGEGSKNTDRTIFVVGDDKQSIFSFQGADISTFNFVNDQLKTRLQLAKKNFKAISLEWSYRSTGEILDVVHHIFKQIKQDSPEYFAVENPKILPFRSTHPGKVELWQPCKTIATPTLFWALADEHNLAISASAQLAVNIASFIKQQLESGAILPSTGKAVTAADFMILVRKRDEFTLELINQLKLHELDVAGIDRMTLNNDLSVADLISAAKFALSPNDKLNLATLLKSPLIAISEEELQDWILAQKGKDLIAANSLNDLPNHAREVLQTLQLLYKNTNAGNFFHILVDQLGGRQTLNAAGSDDAINELLYLAKNYADQVESSLQSFVFWFEENAIEIKRNVEASEKIRVMTAHGSKGLQAPIVILCDTTSTPVAKNKFLWAKDGSFFASVPSANSPAFLQELKEQVQQKDLQEYFRLLYVALTRAEDHLVVCGYQNGKEELPSNCWYNLVARGLRALEHYVIGDRMIYQLAKPDILPVLPISKTPLSAGEISAKIAKTIPLKSLVSSAREENIEQKSVISPLKKRDYLEYGRVFHKILEDSINRKDLNNLKSHPLIETLSQAMQSKINLSIDRVLANKELARLINEGEVKTELSIGIDQGYDTKVGRVDLLVITPNSLVIIDYKSGTNWVMAENSEDMGLQSSAANFAISKVYLTQLQLYRSTMQKLYPHHQIICKILWLDSGTFTEHLQEEVGV